MDKLDNAIVAFLQENGRVPFTEISQKLEVSEGTVRNRVSRLLNEGIVRIVGIADPEKMGYSISAVIAVFIQGGKVGKIAGTIAAFPEVSDVQVVSGEFDLLVQMYCRDSEHLTTFIGSALRTIPGVSHTRTFVVMKTFKADSKLRPIGEF